ncbi:protein unc-13 homolog B-like [Discoglossus pictus]
MVLLCVKVKRGHLSGLPGNINTYVIIKVQNLKSTTVSRAGNEPCWEQDYIFDINEIETDLLVEVWKSGWLRDSVLGSVWIPLQNVPHATDEGSGKWWPLCSGTIANNHDINDIRFQTLHEILLDLYFAVPFGMKMPSLHVVLQRKDGAEPFRWF